jgi:RNA polymerase sigma factor (sigma-70 family)
MAEMEDSELLAAYSGRGAEAAFTTLTQRYVRLVYSAALRQVRDPHLAEEVTQVVFVLLARKAHSFRKGVILSAWLLRATRFTSTNLLVSQYRRIRREQQAVQMQTTSTGDSSWEQIAPLLDEAMSRLGDKDRNALALRFFEQKSLEEVGVALGIDTGTAQKRVWRAVDKLRQYFANHGAAYSAATIAAALSAHTIHGAPSGLAATVAASGALKGAAATSSTATLIKTTLKLMALTKAKTAAVAVVGVLLATATTTITVKEIQEHRAYPWQAGRFDVRVLAKAPPLVAILPSKMSHGAWGNVGSKMMGTGVSAQMVVETAYSDRSSFMPARVDGLTKTVSGFVSSDESAVSPQTVVMAELPPGEYDYIASLPDGNAAGLQAEVKRKFGVVARHETRETNVLILSVKNANAPGLVPDTNPAGGGSGSRPGGYSCGNQPLSSLADFLTQYFKTPVVDRTGDARHFDINLKWDETDPQHPNPDALKQALLDQLGLELVPAIEPIEMLVIEKAR